MQCANQPRSILQALRSLIYEKDGNIYLKTSAVLTNCEDIQKVASCDTLLTEEAIIESLIGNDQCENESLRILIDLSVFDDFVPYTGADNDVDLGLFGLLATTGIFGSENNYSEFESDGTLLFTGTAGMPHGEFHGENISQTITVASPNTAYEVDINALSGGLLKYVTFTGHYLKVAKAGIYSVHWSLSVDTVISQDEIEGGLMVNGQAVLNKGTAHTTVAILSSGSTIAASALLDLAVDDEVSLYVRNHTAARNIVLEHLSCTIVMIAGT